MEYLFAVYPVFSFSHSEVDILLQKYTSVQLEAKTELSNRCPRAQVEVCMHAPISYS